MLVYPVRLIVWMIDDLVDHEDLLQLPGLLQDLHVRPELSTDHYQVLGFCQSKFGSCSAEGACL